MSLFKSLLFVLIDWFIFAILFVGVLAAFTRFSGV